MSYSNMTWEYIPASPSNYTQGRKGYKVCKITPHHMAGVLTGQQCANLFQNPNRKASANYCIGVDGSIVCSVDEENRAWTSSNWLNDCQAITIEVSNNEYGEPWGISDASWSALVSLCVDICRRYGFRLNYDGTPNGSLTRHDMFANTNCPGQTLGSRLNELETIVNNILDGATTPLNTYRGHVQDIGWMKPVGLGKECGTTGKAKRLEAITVNIPDVQYRVHIQNIGWTRWFNSNETAGTTGKSLRLEAINFKSKKKMQAQGHVQNIGWMKPVTGTNITIGTTGKSLRLEAFKLKFV